jgi:Ca2+/H+ antiporter
MMVVLLSVIVVWVAPAGEFETGEAVTFIYAPQILIVLSVLTSFHDESNAARSDRGHGQLLFRWATNCTNMNGETQATPWPP